MAPPRGKRKPKWESKPCARAILMTRTDGRIERMVVPCGRWACHKCATRRTEAIVDRIEDMSGDAVMYVADVKPEYWQAVRKATQRAKAGWVGVKRAGTDELVFLVSDADLSGRGWELEPADRTTVSSAILSRPNRRTDWCRKWRPERTETEKIIIGRVVCPPSLVEAVFERIGYDAVLGRVPGVSPDEAAALLDEAVSMIGGDRESP
jgi:hypothetical protein